MVDVKVSFKQAKIVSLPERKTGQNGDYYSFLVAVGSYKHKIICFDDERVKNPFKKLDAALDKGSVTKGTYIMMDCEMCPYPTYAISDEKWKAFSKGPNPTKVILNNYKLEDWDFVVPYEIHQEIKELRENAKVVPPGEIKPFGDEGGTIL